MALSMGCIGEASLLLAVAWVLIAAAAGYDSYFAWRERGAFQLWEMNPVVRWTAQAGGLQSVIVFKALGIAFGICLAFYCHRHEPRLARRLTGVVGTVYLGLSLYYIGCQIDLRTGPAPAYATVQSASSLGPPVAPSRPSRPTRLVRVSGRPV